MYIGGIAVAASQGTGRGMEMKRRFQFVPWVLQTTITTTFMPPSLFYRHPCQHKQSINVIAPPSSETAFPCFSSKKGRTSVGCYIVVTLRRQPFQFSPQFLKPMTSTMSWQAQTERRLEDGSLTNVSVFISEHPLIPQPSIR